MNDRRLTQYDRRSFAACSAVAVTGGLFSGPFVESQGGEIVAGSVIKADAAGDGVADDTGPIQAAINKVGAAKGGTVFLPAGSYRITSGLKCRWSNLRICGEGGASVICPTGDFDTISFNADHELRQNEIVDLAFDEREKTGGFTLAADSVANLTVERVHGFDGWNGWHLHNFNYVTFNDCRFEYYRGNVYGKASGGGSEGGRSDVLRLFGVVHAGNGSSTMDGLDIDGFVHTVSGAGVYLTNVGGRGLWARNSIHAENNPSFFTFTDLEADYPGDEAIRLEAGEHFYFNNTMVHASRRAAPNIYLGKGVEGVSFTGGFSTGSHQSGIEVEGRSVSLSCMHFHANSSPEFGGAKRKYPGILLGEHSRDVVITGCHSGRESKENWQLCGCQIRNGADGFAIVGNNFRHGVTKGVVNEAGLGDTKLVANNI